MSPVMSRLRQAREPIAWAMTVLCAGFTVVFLVDLCWSLGHDHASLFETARRLSGGSLGLAPLIVLVAAVLWCRLQAPPSPRARLVARVAAWVVAVGATFDLVLAFLALVHAPGGALGVGLGLVGSLLAVGVKVVAIVSLTMVSRASSGEAEEAGAGPQPEPAAVGTGTVGDAASTPGVESGAAEVAPVEPGSGEEPSADVEVPAVWSADTARGASWARAGDAASGAAAQGWGTAKGAPGGATETWADPWEAVEHAVRGSEGSGQELGRRPGQG